MNKLLEVIGILIKVWILSDSSLDFPPEYLCRQLFSVILIGISLIFCVLLLCTLLRFLLLPPIIKTRHPRLTPSLPPRHILTDHPRLLLPNPPPIRRHIIKLKIPARIRNITSDCDGIEEAVVDAHIREGDVLEGDEGLGAAGSSRIEWVDHAAGAFAIGLEHLLWADVDGPPDGGYHGDVLVVDGGDQSAANVPWVGLDIYAFKRILHLHIPKRDIPNTPETLRRRHRPNRHANAQPHRNILHQKVLRTIAVDVGFAAGFGDDDIIPILDGEVVDVHIRTMRINSISIEWKHRDDAFEGEMPEEVDLGSCIYFYVETMNHGFGAIIHVEVELWGILQYQIMYRAVPASKHIDEVGPSPIEQFLIIQK